MSLKGIKKSWAGNMIIGISGKSGSGKSVVSKYICKKLGYTWIDLDKESSLIRDMYKDEIVSLVDTDNILINGRIDSKLLGDLLFNDECLMDKYNNFIYSKLKEKIKKIIKANDGVVIDSIFLPIMEIFSECDYKILVVCDDKERKKRVLSRDNIGEEYFNKRESFGLSYNLNDFSFVVDNNLDYTSQLDSIIEKIIRE